MNDERPRLGSDKTSSEAQAITAKFFPEVISEIEAARTRGGILVVGMAQNPFVRRARKLLATKGIAFSYLEYGSYFSQYRRRLAIKMWAGYPTFPMVFIDGTLIGGFRELSAIDQAGKLNNTAS